MAKKKSSTSSAPATFEEALAELEKIVGELEDGNTGLGDALGRYEQGVKLLKNCYQLLEKAERRIEMLSGVDADGNPITEPLDDVDESLDKKAESRTRRRTKKSKPKTSRRDGVDEAGSLF